MCSPASKAACHRARAASVERSWVPQPRTLVVDLLAEGTGFLDQHLDQGLAPLGREDLVCEMVEHKAIENIRAQPPSGAGLLAVGAPLIERVAAPVEADLSQRPP